jgi:CspA family cold shock protein
LRLGSTEGFGGGDDEGFGGGFGGGDDEGFGGGFGGFGGDDGGFGGGGDEGGFGGDALEAYMEREKGSAVSGRGGGIDLDALGYRGGD